jgi:hypothetical protein
VGGEGTGSMDIDDGRTGQEVFVGASEGEPISFVCYEHDDSFAILRSSVTVNTCKSNGLSSLLQQFVAIIDHPHWNRKSA